MRLLLVCLLAAAPQPTIDLARHFYATPADEAAAVQRIDALVHALESQSLAASADELERTLTTYDSLLAAVTRHDAYLTLRFATNTTDEAVREESRALDARFAKTETAVRRALAAIPEPVLTKFLAERPSLRPYA